jgi:hypothetical protein
MHRTIVYQVADRRTLLTFHMEAKEENEKGND